ncbi:MAG: prepilin-type N-terminal cleavage/methylation domain-containing protein [Thermoguttaceae bacterium]
MPWASLLNRFAVGSNVRNRRGVTLIELLVVVGLMMILMAAAVPRVRTSIDARRAREAARAINVYLGAARNSAVATGRSCGVRIDRLPAATGCSMNLSQVAVPPPYGGDTTTAMATVTGPTGTISATDTGSYTVAFPAGMNTNLVHAGDLIQFNYEGPLYQIQSLSATSAAVTLLEAAPVGGQPVAYQGQLAPWTNTTSQPMPFTILRQPVKSGATPLQLGNAAVVDLQFSGIGITDYRWKSQSNSLMILFSANGGIDRIWDDNGQYCATDTVYLLVGKREKVGQAGATSNLADLTNQWIAVNPQTGIVTTAEVAASASSAAPTVTEARVFAGQGQNMGGR